MRGFHRRWMSPQEMNTTPGCQGTPSEDPARPSPPWPKGYGQNQGPPDASRTVRNGVFRSGGANGWGRNAVDRKLAVSSPKHADGTTLQLHSWAFPLKNEAPAPSKPEHHCSQQLYGWVTAPKLGQADVPPWVRVKQREEAVWQGPVTLAAEATGCWGRRHLCRRCDVVLIANPKFQTTENRRMAARGWELGVAPGAAPGRTVQGVEGHVSRWRWRSHDISTPCSASVSWL